MSSEYILLCLGSIEFTRRWAPGHCILIDATFNTNGKRPPLLIAVGITNEGIIFPIAFAFIKERPPTPSTSLCLWNDALEGVILPAVVIGEQAAGLISIVNSGCLREARLQFCMWHAAEAILAKLHKSKHYIEDEIKGTFPTTDSTKPPSLQAFSWQ